MLFKFLLQTLDLGVPQPQLGLVDVVSVVLELISALFKQFLLLVDHVVDHQRIRLIQQFLPHVSCCDLLAMCLKIVCDTKSFEMRVGQDLLSDLDLDLLKD